MRTPAARGFVFLSMAFGLVLVVGVTGLVVDLGRLYIARTELQAAADAAALAAAYELDGTAAGIERAVAQVTGNPNRWNFGTQAPEFTVAFAHSAAGPFRTEPEAAEGLRYLQVRAKAVVPTYFVPAATAEQHMEALAGAGQTQTEALSDHWIPYSADAPDPKAAGFGLRVGQVYPVRLLDIRAGLGPHYQAAVRQAIVSGVNGLRLAAGDRLEVGDADWETEAAAIEERLSQDTDPTAKTYHEYSGNGRRLVVLPVHDAVSGRAAGFGGFFLRPAACGQRETEPCQAEYVGSAVLPGRKGAASAGVYRVALIQ